jgi:PPK2 family polyphosphate:nucleotide phosphotransferase
MSTPMGDGPSLADVLAAPRGGVDLARIDTAATPCFSGGKAKGIKQRKKRGERVKELQERLFANGQTGGSQRVLIVLQGMDTAGKSGAIKRLVRAMNPIGAQITAFASPTPEERAHEFLWRIWPHVPGPGHVAIWDRSHYEDVVAAPVREELDSATLEHRLDVINGFEADLVSSGTVILKCFLHISREEQRERLLARLDKTAKVWKWSDSDLADRALWPRLMNAYEHAIERTSLPASPWYIVPADRKWYRDWALATLLTERLGELGLEWPRADFDVDAARGRLSED